MSHGRERGGDKTLKSVGKFALNGEPMTASLVACTDETMEDVWHDDQSFMLNVVA